MKSIWMLAGLLALAACAPPTAPAATGSATPTSTAAPGLKLYAMDCGRFHIPDAASFSDEHVYDGQTRDLVDPCYLIRHPTKGDLIWDTGIPSSVATSPPPPSPNTTTLAKTLEAQLTELGLAPADIEFVSFSHAHFDHVGNGNLFAGATWIVDPQERDWMFRAEARAAPSFAAYSQLENARTVLIEGDADHDVFGDGTATIVQAPGHTPGHTVLLLKLNSGPVLLAGDMWHLAEARERRTVPKGNVDRAQTLASMDKVEALIASTHARVVRQHVIEDFDALPRFPAALE